MRRARGAYGRAAFVVALGVLAGAREARATLVDDAGRVARTLADRGADVSRLPPVFLHHGRVRVLAPTRVDEGEGCTTIVLLGARSAELVVDAVGSDDERDAAATLDAPKAVDARTRSVSGIATLVRCGPTRRDLRRVLVELASPRGAVEVIVARSAGPLGSLADALADRAPGPSAPRGDPGPAPEPGPLDARVAAAERRARDEGADRVAHVAMRASARGAGEFDLRLGEGCHRLTLLGEVPASRPRPPTDLDAEARVQPGGEIVARDRGEAADARLDLCLAGPTMLEVPFVGAAGAVLVTVVDAVWPFPEAIPAQWGLATRAAIAGALRRHRAPTPTGAPSFETLGSAGFTTVPVPTEPGRCYLAALGVLRGAPRGLRLAARLAERSARDEVGDRRDGAAIAFCAEAEEVVTLDVEVRGASPWWTLVVWPMGASR
jgi:hypothetical protein